MKLFELVEPGLELVDTLEVELSKYDSITALANTALQHNVDPKTVFEAAMRFARYRLDEIKLVKPIVVDGYTVRGQDDWLVFVTDRDGNWYYEHTEMDPAWLAIPGPGDHFTENDTIKVGIDMLRRGITPRPITDPESIADLEKHFGRHR